MNNKQLLKLSALLTKRQEKIESLNNFGEYFEKFSYSTLKKVVSIINDKLEAFSNEGLRIFYDNPYENKRTRNFVMVQLISSSYRRNVFLLDNTMSFPSLLFEGDEFTGRVKATTSFESKLNQSVEYEIIRLTDEDYVSDIVLDFLDTIYSL